MKQAMLVVKTTVLLLGLLTSPSCIGIKASDLMATQKAAVWPTAAEEARQTAQADVGTAVIATLTAAHATQTTHVTPTDTPSPKIALMSYHGRYVTAMGADDDWSLRQEPELSDCGWFTQHHLDTGEIALVTCHGRYVTAPRRGTTRWDWMLWQESALGDCGQFVLHDLASDEVAFETCSGRFVTAGDGYWEAGLAWSLIGQTHDIEPWERFTVLRP